MSRIQTNMFDDEPNLTLSQWYTPPKLAKIIIEWSLRPYVTGCPLRILDPAAGKGALIHNIPDQHFVTAFDVDERNAEHLTANYLHARVFLADFLTFIDPGHFDLSIMNPPYENDQDLDFARRVMIDGVADRAVMLMRSVFRHGKKRWEEFWRHVDLNRQIDLVTRPKFGGNNTALSDFAVFDVTRRDTPLELGDVQQVEVERWRV